MTTKKNKVSTEETAIVAEYIQTPQSSGQTMYDKACAKEQELTEKRAEHLRTTSEYQREVEERLARIQTAMDTCESCEQKKDDLGQQIGRQRLRLDTYKGTDAEGEHAMILEGLMVAYEQAEKALAKATKEKEELESGRPIIIELQKSIEEEQNKLSEIVAQQIELQAIKQEAWDQIGRDKANTLRGEIEALQNELREHEAAIPYVKDELRRKLDTIKTRLAQWPYMVTSIELSHGAARLELDDQSSDIEHLFFAYISFIRALHTWKVSGPRIQLQGKYTIFEALSLTPQMIYNLMNMDDLWYGRTVKDDLGRQRWEDVCQQIELAEKWVWQEREKNRPQQTIGVPAGTWSALVEQGPI